MPDKISNNELMNIKKTISGRGLLPDSGEV